MSLFKCREWWNSNCGVDENYSEFCMCIGRHGNEPRDILFVGSLEGFLRVYDPRPIIPNSSSSDMLLETQLALPIIALKSGIFSSVEGLQLAVLHPRHLRVLKVNITEGSELNSYCTVDFMYEHELPAHAYSLCVSPNWLCVQTLNDGQLTFFEKERFSMTCRIPILSVLPSPICYVSSSDSIILSDSTWGIFSYSYQTLANSSLEMQTTRTQGSTIKLLSDWVLDFGEPVIDLQASCAVVVALCERYLYCIKDIGQIVWVRKLDYNPLGLALHSIPEYSESLTILVFTDASNMFVYKDNVVEWNSKLPFTPLMLKIGEFQGNMGMMVLASDKGALSICYLGTQQVQYDFCPTPMRAFNYEQGQEEIKRLEYMIRTGKPAEAFAEEDVTINFDCVNGMIQEYLENNDVVAAVQCHVHLKAPKHALKEARVIFVSSIAIRSIPEDGVLVQFDKKGEVVSEVKFYIAPARNLLVDSITVTAKVLVLSASGQGTNHSLKLPLTMALRQATPVREAKFKITLVTNKSAVSVASLFRDLNPDESLFNLVALEHLNGSVVTILVSKSNNKYRLQSDILAGLLLPLVELTERLKSHFSEESLTIGLDSPLPVHELWEVVERHYAVQTDLVKKRRDLGCATLQFEIIQRGFHNKILNAKSAEEVPGMFAALQIAHDYVMASLASVQQLECKIMAIAHELQGAITFVINLMKFGASEAKSTMLFHLERALLPIEFTDFEQDWEKDVEKRLRFLLLQWTSHSKNAANSSAEKEFQITSFKKIFLQTFNVAHREVQNN